MFEALGIEPKDSLAGQKIDPMDLVIKKDTMDRNIAKRAQWEKDLKAERLVHAHLKRLLSGPKRTTPTSRQPTQKRKKI